MMDQIVTFSCSKDVHIYESGCGLSPMRPFRTHATIEIAKKFLIGRGIKNPKLEINKGKRLKVNPNLEDEAIKYLAKAMMEIIKTPEFLELLNKSFKK